MGAQDLTDANIGKVLKAIQRTGTTATLTRKNISHHPSSTPGEPWSTESPPTVFDVWATGPVPVEDAYIDGTQLKTGDGASMIAGDGAPTIPEIEDIFTIAGETWTVVKVEGYGVAGSTWAWQIFVRRVT